MSAEFIKDDFDNIWFVYANKIQYRRIEPMSKIPGFVNEEEAEKQQ